MKTRLIIAFTAIMLLVPSTTEAQVGKLLKKIGQEATKSAVDEKKDEKKSEANPGRALMGLLGGGEEVKHEENYNFTGKIVMEMTTYDDEQVDGVLEYISYLNDSDSNVAIEVKPVDGDASSSGVSVMTIIYDKANQCALMLTDQGDQKTAIATGLDDIEESGVDEEMYESEPPSYNKTGRTKTIAGYRCDEYSMEDGESTVNMWVTRDLDLKLGNKEMQKAGMPVYYGGPFEGGMIMEMEVFEEDQRQMSLIVKDVNMSSRKSFSMAGYSIMNMNMNMGKER